MITKGMDIGGQCNRNILKCLQKYMISNINF